MSDPSQSNPFATPDSQQVAENEAIRQQQEQADRAAYEQNQAQWAAYYQQQQQQQAQWASQQWQGQVGSEQQAPYHQGAYQPGTQQPGPQPQSPYTQPSPYAQQSPYTQPSPYASYQAPQRGVTPPIAITSMVLGIVSIILFQPLGIVAIILGIVGLRAIKRDNTKGRGFAVTGIITGSVGTAILAAIITGIVVLVSTQSAVSVNVDEHKTISAHRAKAGHCLETEPVPQDGKLEYSLVPCSEPHAVEIFSTPDTYHVPGYPVSSGGTKEVAARCLNRSAGAVAKLEEHGLENFEIFAAIPSEEDWTLADDRSVHCLVTPTSGKMQGSLYANDLELVP
ncbi:MAG TPA: DUF4190 domain-containing protein [Actinomycetales bacterium]|nr:DUF4190 domain-containing protein [Actinomycetales bacterium]